MKTIILLLSIISLTLASKSDCKFNSSNSEYDLSFIGKNLLKYENLLPESTKKEVWNLHICDHLEESFLTVLPLTSNIQQGIMEAVEEALLKQSELEEIEVHVDSDRVYTSDSSLGPEKGIRFVFTSDEKCDYSYRSMVIDFICTEDEQILYKIDNSQSCVTGIQINSSKACPIRTFVPSQDQDSQSSQSSSDQPSFGSSQSSSFYTSSDGSFILFNFAICFMVTMISFICTGMCVTCYRRRLRRRDEAMRQMNVCINPSVQVPFFNPYFDHNNMYPVYYPAENPYVNEYPQVVLDIQSDEMMARELQARYDQEHM